MRNTNITTKDGTTRGRHSPSTVRAPVAPKTPPLTGGVGETPLRPNLGGSDSSDETRPPQQVTPPTSPPPSTNREMPALRNARTTVRRRLFIEHQDDTADDTMWETDNRTNVFLENMRVDRERARQMWNFDFETETPLPGVWQWERVENSNLNICNANAPHESNCNSNNNRENQGDAELRPVRTGVNQNQHNDAELERETSSKSSQAESVITSEESSGVAVVGSSHESNNGGRYGEISRDTCGGLSVCVKSDVVIVGIAENDGPEGLSPIESSGVISGESGEFGATTSKSGEIASKNDETVLKSGETAGRTGTTTVDGFSEKGFVVYRRIDKIMTEIDVTERESGPADEKKIEMGASTSETNEKSRKTLAEPPQHSASRRKLESDEDDNHNSTELMET